MWTDPTGAGKPTNVQLGIALLPGRIEAEPLGVTERLVENRLPGGVELHDRCPRPAVSGVPVPACSLF